MMQQWQRWCSRCGEMPPYDTSETRRQSLLYMGHAVRLEDGRIRPSKDFIANLERAEVNRVGKAMAAERGLTFTTAKTGEYVSGTLIGAPPPLGRPDGPGAPRPGERVEHQRALCRRSSVSDT